MNRLELELTNILKGMYENAPDNNTVTMIHLFGIKYAAELQNPDISIQRIATNAAKKSYYTEIRKRIQLAKYVKFNSDGETYITESTTL